MSKHDLPLIAAYDDQWQQPAKTEQWAFEEIRSKLIGSAFFQYVAFPWATLIDYRRRSLPSKKLEQGLINLGPRTTLVRATVCQHIWALDLLSDFKRVGITDIFWSHAEHDTKTVAGIRIHPFPMYPVQTLMGADREFHLKRDLLFNFAGTYDAASYRSKVREWIFDLPKSTDYHLAQRTEWHFEQQTYRSMEKPGQDSSMSMSLIGEAANEFRQLMRRSIFALCPSGTGPNSIRFWEALGFGAIPVLLSDSLRLPGDDATWSEAIIQLEESQSTILQLPHTLRSLAQNSEQLRERRMKCQELWIHFIEGAVENLINPIASAEGIDRLLDRKDNDE